MPNLERQAAQLAASLRRLAFSEEEIARRIQSALDCRARRQKKMAKPHSARRFEGCASISATAGRLGLQRAAMFERLRCEGWLFRAENGWWATDDALSAGWAVMRGSRTIRWPQLTESGVQEIARRMGIVLGAR
jgi:hypothetical protein